MFTMRSVEHSVENAKICYHNANNLEKFREVDICIYFVVIFIVNWFHEIFPSWSKIALFPHCVVRQWRLA